MGVGDIELADGEGVRFLLLEAGVSSAVRSCCLVVFEMLALSNDRFNVASELKLILPSTFNCVFSGILFRTSFTRGNFDHVVVAVVDRCDMVYIISHRKKFHAPFFHHMVL